MNIQTFQDYKSNFKTMLVRRYNWSVSKANNFMSTDLYNSFLDGLNIQEAYYSIFNKEQDLVSS